MQFSRRTARHRAGAWNVCALLLATSAAGFAALSVWAAPTSAVPQYAHRGGRLRLVSEAPRTLDPLDSDSIYESVPVNQIFNGLVAIDPSLRVLPSLATTWTITRDGRVYTFRLRQGVRFHDGSRFTSDDVVFTFRRILGPQTARPSIAAAYLDIVEGAKAYSEGARSDLPGVVAVDDATVRITLDRPYSSFLEVLGMDGAKIIPRLAFQRMGEARFRREPVGTGPFRFQEWSNDRLILAANRHHFAGTPALDAVEIGFLGPNEVDGGAGRFERGEIDVLEIPSESLAPLERDPSVRVRRYQDLNLAFLGLGSARPPLDDERIRQAIAYAIDRQRIVADSPQYRRSAVGILPPGIQAYSPQPKALPYDPTRARQLLAASGHPGGRGLPVLPLYISASREATRRTAARVQTDLAAVGIRIEVKPIPWPDLNRRVDDGEAPLFMLNWLADLSDPDSFLRSLFQSGGSSNMFGYKDPVTDQLLESGARETNPVARAHIYRGLEQRILQHAPIVPLYHPVAHLAIRISVHNFEPGPLGIPSVNFGRVEIADEAAR